MSKITTQKILEKMELTNYDATPINLPSISEFHDLVAHTKQFYPEIYQKHFDGFDFKPLFAKSDGSHHDDTVYEKYVEFLVGLQCAIILPDGSELSSPLRELVPVEYHQPKTLESLINGTLNIGQIYKDFAAREEAEYNEEREFSLFEEVMDMAEKNPDFALSIYSDERFNDLRTIAIAERDSKLAEQVGNNNNLNSDNQQPDSGANQQATKEATASD